MLAPFSHTIESFAFKLLKTAVGDKCELKYGPGDLISDYQVSRIFSLYMQRLSDWVSVKAKGVWGQAVNPREESGFVLRDHFIAGTEYVVFIPPKID